MLSRNERAALDAKVLRLADDEFILGHRNSEWAGHGPILEEDIAFANLAIDELGHGILWYRIVSSLREEDPETFPDKLVYLRNAREFRNAEVVALPHKDWAFSMLRQFLFDTYESVHLPLLAASPFEPIAEAASKIKQEEIYHLHHTKTWTLRLDSARMKAIGGCSKPSMRFGLLSTSSFCPAHRRPYSSTATSSPI